MSISVIVPFRNPGPFFLPLLESLVHQSSEEWVEIVAVDNRSTDGSREVAEMARGRWPVVVVDAPARTNASYARNVGVGAAGGRKLLFVDADDQVAPGYVAAMAAALNTHAFVTSRVDGDTLNEGWLRVVHGAWQNGEPIVFYDFLKGTGVNIGIRRDVFERVGGFPEEFSASQDIAFCWRVQLSGVPLEFVPEAVYYYRYRLTLRALFRQTSRWGISNALLYRTYRRAGMPRRSMRAVYDEWRDIAAGLIRASTREAAAPFVVKLGYCVGRLVGSARYRVFFP